MTTCAVCGADPDKGHEVDHFAWCMDERMLRVQTRIAVALETLAEERTRPKNTKRIRVRLDAVLDDPRRAVFLCTAKVYAIANGLPEIHGQPGLFDDYSGGGRRIVNARDGALSHRIEVPLVVVRDVPELYGLEHIVTVDLQLDPATWGWREWVRL